MRQRLRLARSLRAIVTGKAAHRGRLETPGDMTRCALDAAMTACQWKSGGKMIE
jgi:hypothetical protein